MDSSNVARTSGRTSRLPRGVWTLGFVSLFMDTSSEAIHSLLPVFLVTALGASAVTVGLVEGLGEATAQITKLFSGWLSDRLGRRKLLALVGYGLAAFSKPLFALAQASSWVLAARLSDRIGKGIRGAPRDALVADLTPAELRGAAYGLRQSLDTVGAFAGPLFAMLIMFVTGDNFRAVFWLAVIPAIVAVSILMFGLREPEHLKSAPRPPPVRMADLGRFGASFWRLVAIGGVLTLARFSEAFLVLRAQGLGLSLSLVPLVLIGMNVVYALSAYPVGSLSDRIGRSGLLIAGFGVLIVADLVLAIAPGVTAVMVGVVLWGLHMGMTEGLLAAFVADTAPAALRGSAFGIFYFVSGTALLLASLVAGAVWEVIGAPATFAVGAGLTVIGLIGAAVWIPRGA
jgi:MFS family permease